MGLKVCMKDFSDEGSGWLKDVFLIIHPNLNFIQTIWGEFLAQA